MSEFAMPARIKRLRLPPGRRIIAVSDIHGNLPYLKGLLKKIRFDADDILIIDGDFLEKGPDSLGTLRYIMQLSEAGKRIHGLAATATAGMTFSVCRLRPTSTCCTT